MTTVCVSYSVRFQNRINSMIRDLSDAGLDTLLVNSDSSGDWVDSCLKKSNGLLACMYTLTDAVSTEQKRAISRMLAARRPVILHCEDRSVLNYRSLVNLFPMLYVAINFNAAVKMLISREIYARRT